MAQNYMITAQRWMTVVNAANQFIRQVEITATTPGGTTFQVDIPDSQYSPTAVDALLSAKAADIVAVESL